MSDVGRETGQWSARAALLLAAVLWSFSGFFVKCPALSGLEAPVIAGCRAVTAGLFLLPFVIPHWRRIRFRPGLLVMMLCFSTMNLLFIASLTETTAAAAIFLQYTATLWASLYGAVVLRERISRGTWVAVAFCLTGIVWIVLNDWNGERWFGNLLALGSGLTYAGVIISLRHLREESGPWLMCLNYLASGLVLLPWILLGMQSLTIWQWGALGLMGPLQMALPYVICAWCLKRIDAQEASLILLLEPLLNPLWVALTWGETVPLATLVGGGFILLGLLLRYTLFRETRPVSAAKATVD